MNSLFRRRLRKFGFSLLIFAIMLTCIWQVSVSGGTFVARGWGEWQYYFLAYGDDFTIWSFKPADQGRQNALSFRVWRDQVEKDWWGRFTKAMIRREAGLLKFESRCGTSLGTDVADVDPAPATTVSFVTVPYWMLVLPMSIIAGAMILWNPRVHAPTE